MSRKVFSEIGKLKKVMIHRPGKEVDIIVPDMADDLLFEDILFGELAREEHDIMRRIFEKYGVETFDILDLLIESLSCAERSSIESFIDEMGKFEKLSQETLTKLKEFSCRELGHALIEGVLLPDELMSDKNIYQLVPIPNLLFARDPVIIAYDKILVSHMAEKSREREARLMEFIFTYHPEFKSQESLVDLSKINDKETGITLEGGDFLLLDEETRTVAIAWSKRTNMNSINLLSLELKKIGIKNLIVAKLPHKNAFIHLDTTFTRISDTECLVYPPLYDKNSDCKAEILYFDLTKDTFKKKKYGLIFDCLEDLGINLTPIYCGGKNDLISQKREQWTQGANAFCIAPGIILTYLRNINTIKELSNAGYLCISAEEILKDTFNPDINQKTAILLKSEELCRARGGPRCMVHPLLRE